MFSEYIYCLDTDLETDDVNWPSFVISSLDPESMSQLLSVILRMQMSDGPCYRPILLGSRDIATVLCEYYGAKQIPQDIERFIDWYLGALSDRWQGRSLTASQCFEENIKNIQAMQVSGGLESILDEYRSSYHYNSDKLVENSEVLNLPIFYLCGGNFVGGPWVELPERFDGYVNKFYQKKAHNLIMEMMVERVAPNLLSLLKQSPGKTVCLKNECDDSVFAKEFSFCLSSGFCDDRVFRTLVYIHPRHNAFEMGSFDRPEHALILQDGWSLDVAFRQGKILELTIGEGVVYA